MNRCHKTVPASYDSAELSRRLSRHILVNPGTGSTRGNENFEIPEKAVHRTDLIDKLDILYTNADGLINKRQELKVLINSLHNKPDVVAITEIKPKIR